MLLLCHARALWLLSWLSGFHRVSVPILPPVSSSSATCSGLPEPYPVPPVPCGVPRGYSASQPSVQVPLPVQQPSSLAPPPLPVPFNTSPALPSSSEGPIPVSIAPRPLLSTSKRSMEFEPRFIASSKAPRRDTDHRERPVLLPLPLPNKDVAMSQVVSEDCVGVLEKAVETQRYPAAQNRLQTQILFPVAGTGPKAVPALSPRGTLLDPVIPTRSPATDVSTPATPLPHPSTPNQSMLPRGGSSFMAYLDHMMVASRTALDSCNAMEIQHRELEEEAQTMRIKAKAFEDNGLCCSCQT